MPKNDSYSGGSTVCRLGSSWFSSPQPKVDLESGETREERIRRLAAEAVRRKALNEKLSKTSKKGFSLNIEKTRAILIEQKRLGKVAKNLAKLAEQETDTSSSPRQTDMQQEERMAKVVIEKKHNRKVQISKKHRASF